MESSKTTNRDVVLAICAKELVENEPLRDFLYLHTPFSHLYDFLEEGILAIKSFPHKDMSSLYELEKHLSYTNKLRVPTLLQSRWNFLIQCKEGLFNIWEACKDLNQKKSIKGVNIAHLVDSYCANLLNLAHRNNPQRKRRYRTPLTPLASVQLSQFSHALAKMALQFAEKSHPTLKSIESKLKKNKKAFAAELQREFTDHFGKTVHIISDEKIAFPHLVDQKTASWHEDVIKSLQNEIQSHCDFAFSILEKILHRQIMELINKSFNLFSQRVVNFQNKRFQEQKISFVTEEFKNLFASGTFKRNLFEFPICSIMKRNEPNIPVDLNNLPPNVISFEIAEKKFRKKRADALLSNTSVSPKYEEKEKAIIKFFPGCDGMFKQPPRRRRKFPRLRLVWSRSRNNLTSEILN